MKSLPGDWNHRHIPACSVASLLSAMTDSKWDDIEAFCKLAKKNGFYVALEQNNAQA